MNKVIIVGNVGKAPELKHTQGGQPVINFSVAVNEKWKDKSGQEQKRTEWFSVAYFGKGAEAVAKYLETGKQVLVEGKLQTRSWEKDGVKQYKTEVNAQTVQLLGGKSGGGGARQQSNDDDAGSYGGGGGADFGADEIPFAPRGDIG